jgi:hypothetical protein
MSPVKGIKYIALCTKAFIKYLRQSISAVRKAEKQNKIIGKVIKEKEKMATNNLRILVDGPGIPQGGILNHSTNALYETQAWPVSVDRIGEHFIVKAGCHRLIVHNYKEARAWLIGMADNHVKPMFDRKK